MYGSKRKSASQIMQRQRTDFWRSVQFWFSVGAELRLYYRGLWALCGIFRSNSGSFRENGEFSVDNRSKEWESQWWQCIVYTDRWSRWPSIDAAAAPSCLLHRQPHQCLLYVSGVKTKFHCCRFLASSLCCFSRSPAHGGMARLSWPALLG